MSGCWTAELEMSHDPAMSPDPATSTVTPHHRITIGESAGAYDARRRPFLEDLTAAQIKAATTVVRCEHDRTVVAVVVPGAILVWLTRYERSVHDESVVAPCRTCNPLIRELSTGEVVLEQPRSNDDGPRDPSVERGVPRATRELSTRALWRLADRRKRNIKLSEVLAS